MKRLMMALLLSANGVIFCAASDPSDEGFEREIRVVESDALTRMRTRSFSGVFDQDPNALANIDRLVEKDPDVATALLENVARSKGDYTGKYVKELVAKGADPSGKRKVGSLARSNSMSSLSPLDAAISKGNVIAVQTLLAQGAETGDCRLVRVSAPRKSYAVVKSMPTDKAVAELIRQAEKRYWRPCHMHGYTFKKDEILTIQTLILKRKELEKERKREERMQKKAEEKAAGNNTRTVGAFLGILRFKK